MVEKTTKTVKVPASKAEEWDEYVEDNPEVDTVSHLIRLSVEKEMSGNYDLDRRRESGESGESEAVSGEVVKLLQGIQSAVSQTNAKVEALQRESYADAINDIQWAAFDALPTPPKDYEEGDEMGEMAPHKWAATAGGIAHPHQIDADVADVREVLSYLSENTGQVQSYTGGPDNKTYYFRTSGPDFRGDE